MLQTQEHLPQKIQGLSVYFDVIVNMFLCRFER